MSAFNEKDIIKNNSNFPYSVSDSSYTGNEANNTLDYSLNFLSELSNGSIVFEVIDRNKHYADGYVVLSPSGVVTLINDELYKTFSKDEARHLRDMANNFYKAMFKH